MMAKAGRAGVLPLAICAIGALWVTWMGAAACSKSPAEAAADASSPTPEGGGGMNDAGIDACPPTGPDCYPTPLPSDASSLMILNACTDAQAFDPTPALPLLGPCGKLPPLP
jgi:hypothetical protein